VRDEAAGREQTMVSMRLRTQARSVPAAAAIECGTSRGFAQMVHRSRAVLRASHGGFAQKGQMRTNEHAAIRAGTTRASAPRPHGRYPCPDGWRMAARCTAPNGSRCYRVPHRAVYNPTGKPLVPSTPLGTEPALARPATLLANRWPAMGGPAHGPPRGRGLRFLR
jgi:hypothetical protein